MKLDLLKELYFFELNRKQQLESSLTLPVAVLTGLGGVVFTFARAFNYGFNSTSYVFILIMFSATISLVWVFAYLVRATYPFTYELIPSSEELLSFYEQSKDYYRALGAEFKAAQDFDARMKSAYASANSKNRQNNISKAAFLYRANMGLVAGALFLGAGAVPYMISEIHKPPTVQKIELVKTQDAK